MSDTLNAGGVEATVKIDTSGVAPALNKVKGALQDVDVQAQAVAVSMEGVHRSGRSGAMGLLQLSNAVDDVQYGFRGIVNNIPGIVMGFGGGMGIAGAAQIAAVGINMLVQHWDDFAGIVGKGHTKTEAERMEELGKQTSRTADEQERLNRAKRKEEVKEAIGKSLTKEEKEHQEAVLKTIAEVPREKLLAGLAKSRQQELGVDFDRPETFHQHANPEEHRQLTAVADLERLVKEKRASPQMAAQLPDARKRRTEVEQEIRKRLIEDTKRTAEEMATQAALDPKRLDQLRKSVQAHPENFPAGTSDRLAGIKTKEQEAEDNRFNEWVGKGKDREIDRNDEIATEEEKAEQKTLDDDARESARRTKLREQRRKDRVKDLAGNLQNRVTAEAARGTTEIGPEHIEKELRRAGIDADEAKNLANDVAKAVSEGFDKAATKRALEQGVSRPVAEDQLVAEARKKELEAKKRQLGDAIGKDKDGGKVYSSAEEFAKHLQQSAVQGAGDLQREQRDIQKEIKDLAKEQLAVQKQIARKPIGGGMVVGPS
jgi:hypothetical protein